MSVAVKVYFCLQCEKKAAWIEDGKATCVECGFVRTLGHADS